MILSVAANNATNRWKEGAGIPQAKELSGFLRRAESPATGRPLPIATYLTPTPERYQTKITQVAPLPKDAITNGSSRLPVCCRPPVETPVEVERALEACRKRLPRFPLAKEAETRALLPESWPQGPLPQWMRLLANFPKDGRSRIAGLSAAEEKGDLNPLLKAQVSWIVARQDRAWYALGQAKRRLQELCWSEEQIYRLDGDWKNFTPAERALFAVARKLAASPIVLTDDDVAQAVKLAGARNVVQLISYTAHKACFNRITEASGLQLE
jgi:hypothetical protein